MEELTAAGLSPSEAKCYIALLRRVEAKPSELVVEIEETRTNCYKLLDKLVTLGLAEKFDKDKKIHYKASNPTRLLQLMRQRRNEQEKAEAQLEAATESLIKDYVRVHEQPGILYFQGQDELRNMYEDQIADGHPVYSIVPEFKNSNYLYDFVVEMRHKAREENIRRFALTPDQPLGVINYKESDEFMGLTRTWMKAGAYAAPVEWSSYGDKLAVISYGTEVSGLIISSKQVADSFRQLYGMLEKGMRSSPGYDRLPTKALHVGPTATD